MNKNVLHEALDTIESGVKKLEKEVETVVQPVRESAFKRFLVLFTLLVTFGVVAVFFGFERVLSEISFLSDNPLIMLATGIIILAVTGRLYKKL